MNPKMEAVPLKQNIDNLFTIFQPLCQQQQKTLQASSIDCQLGVWADSKLLDRILTNLLSNALKYTPAGGKISIDVKAEADKVQIIVSDTGIGISPKEQKKLFTSFSVPAMPSVPALRASAWDYYKPSGLPLY